MRPPAVEKLGYYPTDEPVIDILNTYIAPASEKARLFDPCAGEGIAASKLGRALNCANLGRGIISRPGGQSRPGAGSRLSGALAGLLSVQQIHFTPIPQSPI